MDKNKLEKLNKILEIMKEDVVSPSVIKGFLELVLKVIKDTKDNLENLSKEHLLVIKQAVNYIESNKKDILGVLREEFEAETKRIKVGIVDVKKEFSSDLSEVALLIEQVKKIKPIPGKDGKDADEEEIIKAVLKQIPKTEEYVLEGENIVSEINKLSLSPENQIDASHIKNLPLAPEGKANGGGWRNLFQLHDVSLNDLGDGDTLVYNSDTEIWENAAGGSGGGHIIEDEGVALTQRATLNFVGNAVEVNDTGGKTVVTIESPATFTDTFTNQTTINVNHGFGTYPVVQILDNTDAVVIPVSIVHNTTDDFTVTFSSNTTGTIIATVGGGAGGGGGGMSIGGGISGGTPDSVLFVDAGGDLAEDPNLTWDGSEFTIDGKLTVTGAIDPTMLILDEQADDPTEAANKGTIYTKDVGGATQLFYQDSAGTVQTLTTGVLLEEGSIPFADTDGSLIDDNSNLFWDHTGGQLWVGDQIDNLFGSELDLINASRASIGDGEAYIAVNVKDLNPTNSGNFVVLADDDDGTIETGTYGDFGIANSLYITNGDAFNQARDVFLFASEGANNLNISALGAGKKIRFATAGDSVDELRADIADDRFTIYANKDIETVPALTDANWTQAGGWGFNTSPDELELASNAGPNTISPTVSLAPTIGVTYRIVITASATSGAISYTFGGENGTAITATTVTDFITATTTDNLVITGAASATATITSVSVRALIADTGDLFIEGNLKFGSNIQTTTGANILNSDGAGVATFSEIPFLPAEDPTDDNQAVRKAYVDSIASGLSPVASCRVATTTAGTLASDFENGDTVDGVVLATGDRILIKDQVTQSANGIYVVAASGAPSRATDYNQDAEVQEGTFTFISEGTANAGTQWVQLTVNPTIGSSALVFSLLSQTTVYTGSDGVQLTGSDFSAKLSATGAVTLTGAGSDELTVAVDNSSIERSSNALRVKALGITNAMLAGSIADSKLSNAAVANLSGTNTGDQTTVSGNAGTATALQNARTIGGVSFDGTANIVPNTIAIVDAGGDTTTFPMLATSATGSLQPTTDAGLTYNASTNALTATTFVGALTGTASGNLTSSNISDTAYASSWNADTTNAPSKNAVYDIMEFALNNNLLKGLQALGSVIKATTLGFQGLPNAGTTTALTDGQARYVAVYLEKDATITGVKWYQNTAGVYTADNNNYVALYSYSGGTMTQVAISANNGNIWKATANTLASAAFSSPYAATAGIYFVGFLYNNSAQTTAPSLYAGGTSVTSNAQLTIDLTNSAKVSSGVSAQTTLPASQAMSGTTAHLGTAWFALY